MGYMCYGYMYENGAFENFGKLEDLTDGIEEDTRKDEQIKILNWFKSMEMEKAVSSMYAYMKQNDENLDIKTYNIDYYRGREEMLKEVCDALIKFSSDDDNKIGIADFEITYYGDSRTTLSMSCEKVREFEEQLNAENYKKKFLIKE